LGKTEVITWAAEDGFMVEGLLTYPVDYAVGDHVPLFVVPHAGFEVFVQSYLASPYSGSSTYFQPALFASHGFGTLRVNNRGGGLPGHRQDASLPFWKPGEVSYPDLMAGVDHVIAIGLADPERLGIAGWSHGGMVAGWAISHTHRFRAATMLAGVLNLLNRRHGLVPVEFGSELWIDATGYMDHSPLFHAENVTTPSLLLQGGKDPTVPPAGSRLWYDVMTERGVPVELVTYPKAGHLPWRPKAVMDIMSRTLDWFARYSAGE